MGRARWQPSSRLATASGIVALRRSVAVALAVALCIAMSPIASVGSGDPAGAVIVTDWQSVSAGGGFTCGRRTDGTLWCWGHDDHGQLGNGVIANVTTTPVRAGTGTD